MGGLSIRNQAVELAESLSTSFQSNPADGILGLGWVSATLTQLRFALLTLHVGFHQNRHPCSCEDSY